MRPVGSADLLAGRRKAAASMFEQGLSPFKVHGLLGVSYAAARNWYLRWKEYGIAGVASKPYPPRKRKLTSQQLAKLQAVILTGARQAGFPDDTWTCPRVQQWIKQHFKVDYHVDHLSKVLRALKLTPQQPRRTALERDEAKVKNFHKRVWPREKRGVTTAS